MPIRFRCAYCNQLLGIARRKAGTVVRCPGCSGQVVVPSLEEAGLDKGPARPTPGAFEGNDIDKMLEGTEQPSVIQPHPGQGPVLASQYAGGAAPPVPVMPLPGGAGGPPAMRPAGIWLSSGKATLLTVGAVIALALAFAAGLIVGLILNKR